MTPLAADGAELGRFITAMFKHADEGTYASLRTFTHNAGDPPVDITAVEIDGAGLAPLVQVAFGKASRAARHPKPVVFAPPVCTLSNAKHAREDDLANGLGLSVEIDADAKSGLTLLRGLIGPPTVIVASGGEWADPSTGEVQPKLHGHWRLSEPTRVTEEHDKLKLARRLATALVGGDHTNIPVVHPIRWPGSVHRKGQPKLARIVEFDEEAEIDLGEALEALEAAAKAHGISFDTGHGGTREQRDTAALIAEIMSARAYVAPLTALSARYAGGGMTKPKIVETLEGLMLAVPVEIRDAGQPGRWQSRFDGIERMAASAWAKFGPKAKPRPNGADGEAPAQQRAEATAEPAGSRPREKHGAAEDRTMTTHAKLDAAHAELGAALEQAAAAVCRAEAEREAFCSSAPLAEWMADPVARRVMMRQAIEFEFDVAAGPNKDLLTFVSREWLIDRAETLIGERDFTSAFDLAVAALQALCAAKCSGARGAA